MILMFVGFLLLFSVGSSGSTFCCHPAQIKDKAESPTSSWFHPAQQGCEASWSSSCFPAAPSELRVGKLLSGVGEQCPFSHPGVCRCVGWSVPAWCLPCCCRCLPASAACRDSHVPPWMMTARMSWSTGTLLWERAKGSASRSSAKQVSAASLHVHLSALSLQNLLVYPHKAGKGVFVTVCHLLPVGFFVLLRFVSCVHQAGMLPAVSPDGQLQYRCRNLGVHS